jgi:hypothetical protein
VPKQACPPPPPQSYDSLPTRSESKAYRTFRIRNVANGGRRAVHKNGRRMENGLRTVYILYVRLVMQVTSSVWQNVKCYRWRIYRPMLQYLYLTVRDKILCKWVIAQRVVVISYRRFGTTYRSHLSAVKYPKPRKAQFMSNSRRKLEITLSTVMAVHKICRVQQRCGEELHYGRTDLGSSRWWWWWWWYWWPMVIRLVIQRGSKCN